MRRAEYNARGKAYDGHGREPTDGRRPTALATLGEREATTVMAAARCAQHVAAIPLPPCPRRTY